jgi:hypothetical protein
VFTAQVGWYTKIGNRVMVHGAVNGTPTNGTAAGNLQLTGLPFTSNATASSGTRFSVEFQGYTKANFTQINIAVGPSATIATFKASGSGQVTATLVVGDIPSGGAMVVAFSGVYWV